YEVLRHEDCPLIEAGGAVETPGDVVSSPDVEVDPAQACRARVLFDELERLPPEPATAKTLLDEQVIDIGTAGTASCPPNLADTIAAVVLELYNAVLRLGRSVRKERCVVGVGLLLGRGGRHPRLLDHSSDVLAALRGAELGELVLPQRPKPNVHRYFWIWYFDRQSLIVDQSRLSKNASMYDARSVR